MRRLKRNGWRLAIVLMPVWVHGGMLCWEMYPKDVNLVTFCKLRKGMTIEEVWDVFDSGNQSAFFGGQGDISVRFGRRRSKPYIMMEFRQKKLTSKIFVPADGPFSTIEKFIAAHVPF